MGKLVKNKQELVEKTLKEDIAYKGGFLVVKKDQVELPDGKTSFREYIHHPGAVAMLIFDDDNNIYMEYQYRHPVKKVVFEIPAGKLEWGEDPSLAAIRELKEETGITSTELIKIGEMLNSVGYSNEIIHFYYAKIVSVGDTDLDDNEFINVVKMPFSEVKEKVLKNEIKDSKTAFGVMLYDNLVKEGLIN